MPGPGPRRIGGGVGRGSATGDEATTRRALHRLGRLRVTLGQLELQGLMVNHGAVLEDDGGTRTGTTRAQLRVVERRLRGEHLCDMVLSMMIELWFLCAIYNIYVG